jgi:hypothetical protein
MGAVPFRSEEFKPAGDTEGGVRAAQDQSGRQTDGMGRSSDLPGISDVLQNA